MATAAATSADSVAAAATDDDDVYIAREHYEFYGFDTRKMQHSWQSGEAVY